MTLNVVLRTTPPASALSRAVDRAVREADPTVAVAGLREMNGVFAESISRPRLLAQLIGAFAGLALSLAAVGTYGLLSYMVVERRREIGSGWRSARPGRACSRKSFNKVFSSRQSVSLPDLPAHSG